MAELFTIFKNYCGTGIFPLLFLAVVVYLLVTEKEKRIRVILVESSAVITILFFLPIFKMVMDKLDEGTYYRLLWMLPMTIVIAYAGVKVFGRYHRIGFVVLAVLFILTGSCVYKNQYVSKAENRYHIPNNVIAICNEIMPAEDEERIWAVFPDELIHFVRQYSSEIQMPYGREMLVASWEWNWDTHPIYRIMKEDPIDLDALAPLLEEYYVQYLIHNKSRPVKGDFAENSLVLVGTVEAYDIYRFEKVEIFKKSE